MICPLSAPIWFNIFLKNTKKFILKFNPCPSLFIFLEKDNWTKQKFLCTFTVCVYSEVVTLNNIILLLKIISQYYFYSNNYVLITDVYIDSMTLISFLSQWAKKQIKKNYKYDVVTLGTPLFALEKDHIWGQMVHRGWNCCNINQIRIYILPFSMFRIKVKWQIFLICHKAHSDNKCQWTIQQTSQRCYSALTAIHKLSLLIYLKHANALEVQFSPIQYYN